MELLPICIFPPQAGLYGQVVKWFQNHSYSEKESVKKKKIVASTTEDQSSDDEAAVGAHLRELAKELKKKQSRDEDKISRLLSLTFSSRRANMMAHPANPRISTAIQEYPCLKSALYVCFCRPAC